MRTTPEGLENDAKRVPLPGIDCLGRDEVRAYTMGYRAGRQDYDANSNPYVHPTKAGWGGPQAHLWLRWSRGWLDGQEDRLLHGC